MIVTTGTVGEAGDGDGAGVGAGEDRGGRGRSGAGKREYLSGLGLTTSGRASFEGVPCPCAGLELLCRWREEGRRCSRG